MALTKVPNSMLVSPGGSTKNYLSNYNNNPGNGDFELNVTNGWSLFNTTITNQAPTGSIVAGASSLSFSTISSGKLAGSYSLRVRAVDSGGGGIWTAGQGFISDAFTVDEQDTTSVMQFKFSYKGITNTSRLNVSGTTSNTLAVYIYDVTNSKWIQPSSAFGINQRATVGFVTGSFQAVATSTQYRIAVLAINGSGSGAGDIVIDFDDYIIGLSNYTYGSPNTDWNTNWIPTGSWTTNSTYTGQWRQNGDEREYKVKVALTGAPTSANLVINLPSGHVIDTVKLPQITAGAGALGYGNVLDSGVAVYPVTVNYNSSTQVALYVNLANSTYVASTNINQIVPITFGASDAVDIQFSVPILGSSSSVQMSDGSDARIVDFHGTKLANQSVTGDVTDITFVASKDSHARWNGSAYVVDIPGDYVLMASVADAGTTTTSVYPFISGVKSTQRLLVIYGGNFGQGSTLLTNLKSGDLISIRTNSTTTVGGSGFLSLFKISGLVTIAASSKVNSSGSNSAGTSIPNGVWTAVPTPTISINSHGSLSTSGIFISPSPDSYTVTGNVCFTANATGIRGIRIRKNNAATGFGAIIPATSGGAITSVPIAGLVQCNEGENMIIECFQNSGAALALSTDPDTFTTFTITRK